MQRGTSATVRAWVLFAISVRYAFLPERYPNFAEDHARHPLPPSTDWPLPAPLAVVWQALIAPEDWPLQACATANPSAIGLPPDANCWPRSLPPRRRRKGGVAARHHRYGG